MILESKYFTIVDMDGSNEVTSIDMGIVNAVVSNGMHKQQIVGARKILETKIPGRATPYFYGVDKSPLQFKISLATAVLNVNSEIIAEGATTDELNIIVSHFLKNTYRTIKFHIAEAEDSTTVSYDFVVVGSPEIEYIGDSYGKHAIINLNMRCNTFSGYNYKVASGADGVLENVINNYHEAIYPNIVLTTKNIVGPHTISIADGDNVISIGGCSALEEITIDMTTRIISSNLRTGLYSDWNRKYLKLIPEEIAPVVTNNITATNCSFTMNWKEPKLL